MPILDVERAKTVLFVKRSLASGHAGIGSELFLRDNTMMLFSDAKKMVEQVVKAVSTVQTGYRFNLNPLSFSVRPLNSPPP